MINWHRLINNEVTPEMTSGETFTALRLMVERYNDNSNSLIEFLDKREISFIANGKDLLEKVNRCKEF